MRHIKFRAWDKNDKAMIDWFTLSQTAFNHGLNKVSLLYQVVTDNIRFDKMLQLGQQDKNGKDIYASDIMKVRARTEGRGKNTRYKEFNMLVCWNDYTAGFDLQFPEGYGQYRFIDGSWGAHEIIGNLYEHPTLLA